MDERELLSAVIRRPDESEPRVAYAQWLERDPPVRPDAHERARLIRAQLQLYEWDAGRYRPTGWSATYMEARKLETRHGAEWAGDVAPLVETYGFRRGFVEQIRLPARSFLDGWQQLYALAPVRHLALTDAAPHVEELAASPALGRAVSLSIASEPFGDDEVRVLAASPYLGRLAWLDLSGTGAGLPALEALAEGPALGRLGFVGFEHNACPPPSEEPVGVDWMDGSFQHWQATSTGMHLLRTYGERHWINFRALGEAHWPPDRDGV